MRGLDDKESTAAPGSERPLLFPTVFCRSRTKPRGALPPSAPNGTRTPSCETTPTDQWLFPNLYRQGAQGTYDTASHAALDNEFGTHVDEEVIKQILEKGTLQESEVS